MARSIRLFFIDYFQSSTEHLKTKYYSLGISSIWLLGLCLHCSIHSWPDRKLSSHQSPLWATIHADCFLVQPWRVSFKSKSFYGCQTKQFSIGPAVQMSSQVYCICLFIITIKCPSKGFSNFYIDLNLGVKPKLSLKCEIEYQDAYEYVHFSEGRYVLVHNITSPNN